jgi:O-antigen/teichoic acid export membrane protein
MIDDADAWSSSAGANHLDSRVMEARDRLANLGFLAAGGIVFILVALVFTTRDPTIDSGAGYLGALLLGLALGLLTTSLFWLAVFGRHRRIAYRGDWPRAIRRGGWVFLVTALFVILRLNRVFQLEIALFVLALVAVAEATLSVER